MHWSLRVIDSLQHVVAAALALLAKAIRPEGGRGDATAVDGTSPEEVALRAAWCPVTPCQPARGLVCLRLAGSVRV